MAQCKACGNKGFFLFLDKAGLCGRCASQMKFDFDQRYRIIEDSQKIIANSKSLKTILHRMHALEEHLTVVAKYEAYGTSLMTPPASAVLAHYADMKRGLIEKAINEEITAVYNKASVLLSIKSKITETNKVLVKIAAWRNDYAGENIDSLLNEEEAKAAKLVHDLQLKAFLEEAEKAMFMGQKNRATGKFQEALYFLKTDAIADEQQRGVVEDIEKKIASLK